MLPEAVGHDLLAQSAVHHLRPQDKAGEAPWDKNLSQLHCLRATTRSAAANVGLAGPAEGQPYWEGWIAMGGRARERCYFPPPPAALRSQAPTELLRGEGRSVPTACSVC